MQRKQAAGVPQITEGTARTEYAGEQVLVGPYVLWIRGGNLYARDVRGPEPQFDRPKGQRVIAINLDNGAPAVLG